MQNLTVNSGIEQVDPLSSTTKYSLLQSKEDQSVNFVFPGRQHGFLEARYIRRTAKTVVVYLSSQTGCDRACRFCHLTATQQTKYENATIADFVRQSEVVLNWYDKNAGKAEIVHFNFMARGEALANPNIIHYGDELLQELAKLSRGRGLFSKYLVSSIMPVNIKGKAFTDMFPVIHPEIYYSIYSMEPTFRKKWLPRALPAEEALIMLKEWQDMTAKIPKLHYCFIEGENDSEATVKLICEAVNDLGLRVNINIVRYNPYSNAYGQEPLFSVIQRNAELFERLLPHARVKIVARIGFDVKASCGMFVNSGSKESYSF